jgi:exonuclease III
MRIVAWNIRAGGGRRAALIADQLRRWRPAVVALSEFRATPPSVALAEALAEHGLRHQQTTADGGSPASNRLLVASRWPLERTGPRRDLAPAGRWLVARVDAPRPFALVAVHVPNRVSGMKEAFLEALLRFARRWRGGPALLIGDTNSGWIGIDEQAPAFNAIEDGWMTAMERAGWRDAYRHLHGESRAYTWYSPNGRNGFRLDEAFVSRALLPRLIEARYRWGRPRDGGPRESLSDHAALIVDLAD